MSYTDPAQQPAQQVVEHFIFVDLDDTLIKTTHCRRGDIDSVMISQNGWREYYTSIVRGGALDLLKELRAIPNSHVFMLTAATEEYAVKFNRIHGLGFHPLLDIFHRDDIGQTLNFKARFGVQRAKVTLIDDLPMGENPLKVRFLRQIALNGVVNYYRINISPLDISNHEILTILGDIRKFQP